MRRVLAASLALAAPFAAAAAPRREAGPRPFVLTGHMGLTLIVPTWVGLQAELPIADAFALGAYGDLNPWGLGEPALHGRAAAQLRWYYEGDTRRGGAHMAPTFEIYDGAPGAGLVVGQRLAMDGWIFDWQGGIVGHVFEERRSFIAIEDLVVNFGFGGAI